MTELDLSRTERLFDFNKEIFQEKYAVRDNEMKPSETEVSQAFKRVSGVLAKKFVESIKDKELYDYTEESIEETFYKMLSERRGMLAGRPLLAIGNKETNVTALNCFVLPVIDDSIEGIYETIKQAAKVQQAGGGVGFNFSKIRPRGAFVKGVKAAASGPISFMRSFDSMVATIASAGNRRGAAIAILDVNHPDIMEFITAKKSNKDLTNFNISIGVTKEFIDALKTDGEIELKHGTTVYGKIRAREIFEKFVDNTYDYNEPGILFKDRVNEYSNSWYFQKIEATNPCGEITLPDYGCCDLGMIVLPTFVKSPFVNKEVDIERLKQTVHDMVWMLDAVLDETNYPLKQTEKVSMQDRRIGVGVTGLGDMLVMLRIKYDSEEAIGFVDALMQTIRNSAYEASVELSQMKGPFPKFDKEKFLQGKFVQTLPDAIKRGIEEHGIRNVAMLTCQPAGTISLLLNNVSSGIEPIFSLIQNRRMRDEFGNLTRKSELRNYAFNMFKSLGFEKMYGERPDFFQTTRDVSLDGHLKMQNKIQQYIDNSISKTINFPETTSKENYRHFMKEVFTGNYYIKGMTVFREGTIASILTDIDERPKTKEALHKMKAYKYQIFRRSNRPSIHTIITFKENEIREMFLSCKDLEYFKQLLPIARLLSMMFTREKNLQNILELLKELEDMNYIEENYYEMRDNKVYKQKETFIYNNREYDNILAAVKDCIWDTLTELGLIKVKEEVEPHGVKIEVCSKCNTSMVKEGKCYVCPHCGNSPGTCAL
jgi:ribonucleoside-diphosphate reductase alpha chain